MRHLPESVQNGPATSCDNGNMSVQEAAAQALSAVEHAQALFGPIAEPLAQGPSLETGTAPLAGAEQRAAVLSGDAADEHRSFADSASAILHADNETDTTLSQALANAATVTQRGRTRLDTIVSRTRLLAQAASATRSATGQRILLHALQTEVSNADAVVNATQQHGTAIASQVRGLNYEPGAALHPAGYGIVGAPAPQAPPLPLPEPPPHPSGTPPPPPGGHPSLHRAPAPLQDFTTYTLNGLPVPPPPPPNVTADQLRLRIMQQGIDADKFMAWYQAQIPKSCSFGEMLARMGGFIGSTGGAIGTVPTWPEGAPLTVAALAGALGSAYALGQCIQDPYAPLPPYPGP
jgi:hypothetical protein